MSPDIDSHSDSDASDFERLTSKPFVLTCMDPRLDPVNFGVKSGSAYIGRNAGGRATEALRSIIIAQQCMGADEIRVVHHTDCGMLKATDESIQALVKKDLGADASHITFLAVKALIDSVKKDVAFLKNSPFVRKVPISGYIYDVDTKKLEKIC